MDPHFSILGLFLLPDFTVWFSRKATMDDPGGNFWISVNEKNTLEFGLTFLEHQTVSECFREVYQFEQEYPGNCLTDYLTWKRTRKDSKDEPAEKKTKLDEVHDDEYQKKLFTAAQVSFYSLYIILFFGKNPLNEFFSHINRKSTSKIWWTTFTDGIGKFVKEKNVALSKQTISKVNFQKFKIL